MHPVIKKILKKRGISTAEEAVEFLSYKPRTIYDPFLMKDMDRAVDLLLAAVDRGDRICIYGDYDVDGVTSVALMKSLFACLGSPCAYYIPSRFDEGYGLHREALDTIKKAGADIVITVDCGCTSVAEVAYAKQIGLEILITDHHEPGPEQPDCIVLDPHRKDCPYPFKDLAGVGVAFKLFQAVALAMGLPKTVLTRNMDLLCIGTVADVVPLLDENRSLVKYGLRSLRLTQRPGLIRLMEDLGLDRSRVQSQDIAFSLAPPLNAAGRMGDAALAARLLLTEEEEKARIFSQNILEKNRERKSLQEAIFTKARGIIDREQGEREILILKLADAHEGVIGIVAGKLKDRFRKPTLILVRSTDKLWKGTGRSTEDVDLFRLLNAHASLFTRFGGHKAACGFTIEENRIEELEKALEEDMRRLRQNLPHGQQAVKKDVDLRAEDVSLELCDLLEILEPFGKGNERPVFSFSAWPTEMSRMGSEGQYLRFRAGLEKGREIEGVDFSYAAESENILQQALVSASPVCLTGELEARMWKDRKTLQVKLTGPVEDKHE